MRAMTLPPDQHNTPIVIPEQDSAGSLRDILHIIFRHKWKIIIFFCAVVATVTIKMLLTPSIYESHAKLLVRPGRDNTSVNPSLLNPGTSVKIVEFRENQVNSELGILTSQTVIKKVVDQFGPDRFLTPEPEHNTATEPDQTNDQTLNPELQKHNAAVNALLGGLAVEVEEKTNIINVSLFTFNPDLAQAALDSLIAAYLERHLEVHKAQANPEFFRVNSQKLFEHLLQKEDELEQFRELNNIVELDAQKDSLLTQISALEGSIAEADSQIEAALARIESLQQSLVGRSESKELNRVTGRVNTLAVELKRRLVELQLKEADLAARYPGDARVLVDLRKQIKITRQALAREQSTVTEVTMGIDGNTEKMQLALDTEKATYKAQLARKQALLDELATKNTEINQLASYKITLDRLMREVEFAEREYLQYRDSLQKSEISDALDTIKVSNVSIVQPATFTPLPVRPKKKLIVLVSMFLGLLGGLGLAFILEFFDESLKSQEDVRRRLGLPVLATFSDQELRQCI